MQGPKGQGRAITEFHEQPFQVDDLFRGGMGESVIVVSQCEGREHP